MEEFLNWFGWYIVKYSYLFLIILTLAALEVQIEGKWGWVKKLPTWRIKSKVFGYFMGGKELTGYLFYLLILLILFFHLPFIGGVPWSFNAELEIIFLLLLFSVFWDFLWFVLNPYFGIKRFKKSYVYWHHHWFAGMPVDYPRGIILSFMIALIGYPENLAKWGIAFGIFMIGTFVVVIVNSLLRKAPHYWNRHKPYKK